MISARLNHIALDVCDRAKSAIFYRDLLGAELVAEDAPHHISFLRFPGSTHYSDLALHENPRCAEAQRVPKMAHTGFQVESATALVEAYDFFRTRSRVVMAADFGVAWSVIGTDLDGNLIEFELFHVGAVDKQPGFARLNVESLRSASNV